MVRNFEKFEIGHYYLYTDKEEPMSFDPHGIMRMVLDNKPRKCIKVTSTDSKAAVFEGMSEYSGNSNYNHCWIWEHGFDNWIEVEAPDYALQEDNDVYVNGEIRENWVKGFSGCRQGYQSIYALKKKVKETNMIDIKDLKVGMKVKTSNNNDIYTIHSIDGKRIILNDEGRWTTSKGIIKIISEPSVAPTKKLDLKIGTKLKVGMLSATYELMEFLSDDKIKVEAKDKSFKEYDVRNIKIEDIREIVSQPNTTGYPDVPFEACVSDTNEKPTKRENSPYVTIIRIASENPKGNFIDKNKQAWKYCTPIVKEETKDEYPYWAYIGNDLETIKQTDDFKRIVIGKKGCRFEAVTDIDEENVNNYLNKRSEYKTNTWKYATRIDEPVIFTKEKEMINIKSTSFPGVILPQGKYQTSMRSHAGTIINPPGIETKIHIKDLKLPCQISGVDEEGKNKIMNALGCEWGNGKKVEDIEFVTAFLIIEKAKTCAQSYHQQYTNTYDYKYIVFDDAEYIRFPDGTKVAVHQGNVDWGIGSTSGVGIQLICQPFTPSQIKDMERMRKEIEKVCFDKKKSKYIKLSTTELEPSDYATHKQVYLRLSKKKVEDIK